MNLCIEELKFSGGNSYTVSQLISETMDTEKLEHQENEIPEIIEFCKLNTKIYSESLVFDRFFAYTDCSTPAVLKLMDVDFQKIVFESEKQDSSVIKMCCFDSYCIYVTKNKKFYLRDMPRFDKNIILWLFRGVFFGNLILKRHNLTEEKDRKEGRRSQVSLGLSLNFTFFFNFRLLLSR